MFVLKIKLFKRLCPQMPYWHFRFSSKDYIHFPLLVPQGWLKDLVTWHSTQLQWIQFYDWSNLTWTFKFSFFLSEQEMKGNQSPYCFCCAHSCQHFSQDAVNVSTISTISSVVMSWQCFTATLQLNCTVSSAGVAPMFLPLFTNITWMDSNWIYRFKSIS